MDFSMLAEHVWCVCLLALASIGHIDGRPSTDILHHAKNTAWRSFTSLLTDPPLVSQLTLLSAPLQHRLLAHTKQVEFVAFSNDANELITVGHQRYCRWDVRTGNQRGEVDCHEKRITGASVSNDGAMLATASFDGTVRIWELANGRKCLQLPVEAKCQVLVAFSPNGRTIVTQACSGALGGLQAWDGLTGKEITKFGNGNRGEDLVFLPDGKHVVQMKTVPCLFDTASWGNRGMLRELFNGAHDDTKIAVSPDRRFLATQLHWPKVEAGP